MADEHEDALPVIDREDGVKNRFARSLLADATAVHPLETSPPCARRANARIMLGHRQVTVSIRLSVRSPYPSNFTSVSDVTEGMSPPLEIADEQKIGMKTRTDCQVAVCYQ